MRENEGPEAETDVSRKFLDPPVRSRDPPVKGSGDLVTRGGGGGSGAELESISEGVVCRACCEDSKLQEGSGYVEFQGSFRMWSRGNLSTEVPNRSRVCLHEASEPVFQGTNVLQTLNAHPI